MAMLPSERDVDKRPTPDDFGVDLEKAKQKQARRQRSTERMGILGEYFLTTLFVVWFGLCIGVPIYFGGSADDIGIALFLGWLGSWTPLLFGGAFLWILGVILRRMYSSDPEIIALKRYESALWEHDRQKREKEMQREKKIREEEMLRESRRLAEVLRKKRQQREHWLSLSGHEFEHCMAELFRKAGMEVSVTPGSDDGGVDLFLNADRDKIAVQCKAHKKQLSPAIAREFYGALKDKSCAKGILIGLGGFTARTREFAGRNQIELWDVEDVIRFAQDKVPVPSGRS